MLSTEMTFISCANFGDADVLHPASCPVPMAGANEVLIKVTAAGINRADIMQRRGKYPPPAGASDILGMEVSGTVAALGTGIQKWKIGDKVCALLAGGGYAEYVAAPEGHCLPIPSGISLKEAAALPEAVVTVYANLFEGAGVKAGETVLLHGGASGIGTMAVQMLKAFGARVFVTVGNAQKADFCRKLGADLAIDYKQEDFTAAVKAATNQRGVDIVLDMVGGSYINRNLQALAPFGRHVSIATQAGSMAEVDIRLIMQKRLILTGSTMRGRDSAEKARLIAEIEAKIWPLIASGKIKPVIYQSFPLKNAAEAHKVMESSAHIGKITLEVS
jgi:putative PIG3 family NAD(P)H quinone oxidoreductase